MTPEEAKEKYGIKTPSANEEKGYVYCEACPLFQKTCEYFGTGYGDCWERIAKSTGWEPEEEKKSDAVNCSKHLKGENIKVQKIKMIIGENMKTLKIKWHYFEKRKILYIILAAVIFFMMTDCSEASRVSYNLSKEADNFNDIRQITVINCIQGDVLFQMTGKMSITADTTDNQLEVVVEDENGEYKKHFIGLSDNVTYVVEDVTSDDVNKYKYTLNFNPKMWIPEFIYCQNTKCEDCRKMVKDFFKEEYKGAPVDWSKVQVDTPILVRDSEECGWENRHFAKYENDMVYAWYDGRTSYTSRKSDCCYFEHAKLAEEKQT